MIDRRGFFRKLLALPMIPSALKNSGAGGGASFTTLKHGFLSMVWPTSGNRRTYYGVGHKILSHEDLFTRHTMICEMGETEIDPNLEEIPMRELAVGSPHRIFQATEQIQFGEDVVPGGYVKSGRSEAKMTSFGETAFEVGQLEVYENIPTPCPQKGWEDSLSEKHTIISDINGTRYA